MIDGRRGYFGVGIYQPKCEKNLGTLWRSAFNFGADFIFTIGARYKHQRADTVKAWKHVPYYAYDTFEHFNAFRPAGCDLIAIEQTADSSGLVGFKHPERAVYLLGAEDFGIPADILRRAQQIVHIDTPLCVNVSVAGSIAMYDRAAKDAKRRAAAA